MKANLFLVLLASVLVSSFGAERVPANVAQQAATTPTAIRIDAIQVLGRVEAIAIVNGVMQSPINLAEAGWYEATAKVGSPGNIVMTGYYYWAGKPALFANLALLAPGDVIEVTGADGKDYRYGIRWVRTFEKATAPIQEIVGPTVAESLTLITDAGEADLATGDYPRSTVVRATRLP